jgi:hypothetical protein
MHTQRDTALVQLKLEACFRPSLRPLLMIALLPPVVPAHHQVTVSPQQLVGFRQALPDIFSRHACCQHLYGVVRDVMKVDSFHLKCVLAG